MRKFYEVIYNHYGDIVVGKNFFVAGLRVY